MAIHAPAGLAMFLLQPWLYLEAPPESTNHDCTSKYPHCPKCQTQEL